MATDREISRVRHDRDEWRGIVRKLIKYAGQHDLEDRHVDLLDGLESKTFLNELSVRQAEWLLDIRDDVDFISEHRGVSVRFLIRSVYENRHGLDDEEDMAWVEEIWRRHDVNVRKREARRLYALARPLGLLDD